MLALGQNNAEKMRIHSNGNVGIGTTSPGHKLEVSGDTRTNSLFINTSSNIAGSIFTIANSSTATGINVNAFYDINRENTVDTSTVSTYGTVNRITVPSDFSNSLVVTQNNVARSTGASDITGLYPSLNQSSVKGTGTVDYAIAGYNEASLDNADGTVNYLWGTHTEVQLKAGTVGNISLLNFDFDQTAGTTITGDFQYIQISNDQPVSNITGTARALNIESDLPSFFSGSIGIGTNSPNAKLQVNSGGSGNIASFQSEATAINEYAGITLHTQVVSNDDWYGSEIRSINTGGTPSVLNPRLGFFTQDLGTYLPVDRTEKLSILGNGNVGIGTTSPTTPLQVAGIAQIVTGSDNAFYGGNYVRVFGDQNYGFRNTGGTYIANISMSGNSYFNGGNVGIGTTSPGAKLDIVGSTLGLRIKKADLSDVLRVYTQGSGIFMDNGNVHISDDLKIGATLLSNQENTDIDSAASEVVAQVSTTDYTAAFFDFVVKKGTNIRSGTVYACHDGTNVEFTETSTNDLGDTSDVTLSVDISGANMRLLATVTSDDWSVKSLIRAI